MKMETILLVCCLTLVLRGVSGQPFHPKYGNLLILHEKENIADDMEFNKTVELLKSLKFSNVNILSVNDLVKHTGLLHSTDIIWYYKNDTVPLEPPFSKKLSSYLKKFTESGGKLVLANQACIMIPWLIPGEKPPETRIKPSRDEGNGRRLGYHAFREHPLFEGMNGGAYVLKPLKDTTVLQTGYFGDNKPTFGKVIGIDWDYIFFRESSKLIMEYQIGKGKILAIGSYLLYGLPNSNRVHLETFTENIFIYLTETKPELKELYWNYDTAGVTEKTFQFSQSLPHSVSGSFPELDSSLSINPGKSTGNYWDLAGERILLMGEDHGRIREIWAHPVLCLRDYQVTYRLPMQGDSIKDLESLRPEIEVLPSAYVRKFNLTGDLTGDLLGEYITVSPHNPFSIIHYDYQGVEPIKLDISFRLLFRLMWPYSEKVLGNLFYSWNEDLQAFIASDQSGEFVTIVGINSKKNLISWSTSGPDDFKMPSKILSLHVDMDGPGQFDVIIASCSEGLEKTLKAYLEALADPGAEFIKSQSYADSVLDQSLEINGPDKEFNDGYRWALLATDRFQVQTPGIGTSLVAGYATSDKGWDGQHVVSGRPGYGWYFGRDGVWSGFALLHYGAFEDVRHILETFQCYQDLNGKIFHELSTSGVVHYDAADATPLYIILAGRYLRHSGDSTFIRESWPYIKKAIDFCYSTDTDGDLLIENTNVGHGWEEGGQLYGSHTTLYLASCWAAALDEAAYMAKNLKLGAELQKYAKDALAVKMIISNKFWNPQKNYFYHGLMPDGSYKEDVSITAAIPLLFNQADHGKVKNVLPVLAASGFTSDWGCRIVEEGSPHFDPGGYHTGSVWPLFTGWTALAEFRSNNFLQGYSHLMSNILIYKYWGLGFIEEVLNGETYEPFGVCHHQCWSETMALQPVIEGMLGYQPDALKHKMSLKPWFPADWDSVSVKGIRIGDEEISMEARRHGGMEAGKLGSGEAGFFSTYTFSKEPTGRLGVQFQPVFPPGALIKKVRVNGLPAKDPGVRETDQGWLIPDFGFWLDSSTVVEIIWEGGISALPAISHPKPGDSSEGLRIINTSYLKGTYTVETEGISGKQYFLDIWTANPEKYKAEGAEIAGISGNIISLKLDLPDTGTKYAKKDVILSFEF
jgi:glycogen debranching enzyme